MTYGKRLNEAVVWREGATGRRITRKELAQVAVCTVQNIGMILTNAKGKDQKLATEANTRIADFLQVDQSWLATGEGNPRPERLQNLPSTLTSSATEMAVLYDMIPTSDPIRRAKAFNAATDAIMKVLQDGSAKPS